MLTPSESFAPLPPGEERRFRVIGRGSVIRRSDAPAGPYFVSADGAVTGEAACSLITYANVVFAELDAEVVGSSIVGDAIFTYNRQEIIVPIDGIITEDRLWIDLEVEYDPTSQLTNQWDGSIQGTL